MKYAEKCDIYFMVDFPVRYAVASVRKYAFTFTFTFYFTLFSVLCYALASIHKSKNKSLLTMENNPFPLEWKEQMSLELTH